MRFTKSLSYDILLLPDFRRLLFTRMFATLGYQAQAVIVGWQVYEITKDPWMLGLIGLTEAVPAILSALYAGHLVDVSNPKKVFRICLAALILNTLCLLYFGGGFAGLSGTELLPWIFGSVFISGLARAFIMPASFSLLPLTVARTQISGASAWMSSGFQAAAITGPALAGLLYAFGGAAIAWMMPALMMLCAFILIARLQIEPPPKLFEQKPAAISNIREGWRFLQSSPVLLSVMTLDMFAVLLGGAVSMLPAFASEVLHTDADGLGILRAGPAIGAITMSLVFALRPIRILSGYKLMAVVSGFGACMIGFGMSTTFAAALFFLILSGMFDSVSVILRGTIMQMLTPEHMRGRVSSVNSMFIISSNEIGAFQSGLAAKLLGLVPSIVAGGIAAILVVATTAYLAPSLRRMHIETQEKKT